MKEFSEKDIEGFYLETMQGFYLSNCAKSNEDSEEFYKNQLGEFTEGFKCCLSKIKG